MAKTALREKSKTTETILFAGLALPLLLRAVAGVAPGSWLWGFDTLHYLPAWAWLLWLLPAAALFFAAKETSGGRKRGDAVMAVAALVTLALVLVLPDRVQFVGDFLLRQGTAEEALPPSALFPQALPLDVLLHVTLPTWAHESTGIASTLVSRILDAVEAGVLVLLAFTFARRAGLKGREAIACALLASWGGWLAIFTGYSKAFTEMGLLVLACAIAGTDALRGSRAGFLYLCAAVAAGFAVHRSAAGFLPALGYVSWYALRAPVPAAAPKSKPKKAKSSAAIPGWLPLLLPLTVLALCLPKIISSATTFDTAHFAAKGEGPLGIARHVIAPLHLLDLLNLVFFLVPLALLALVPAPKDGKPGPWSRREWIYFVVLGAPFWLVTLVLRPAQGIPRDFDVFTTAGVALGVIAAARVARLRQAAPSTARYATAIAAGAIAPMLCFLLLQADLTRGLVRVNALADGPPLRSESERARWREYLGARYHRAKRYKEAVAEFAQAAALAPSPNILAAWGVAARWAGDEASEERAFTLLLERAPADRVAVRAAALTGLARIAFERGDRERAKTLVSQALALDPESQDARSLAARLASGAP